MGNINSNVDNSVKAQASSTSCSWYKLMDIAGGGELVEMMKKCSRSKDYDDLEATIREKFRPYLYNNGEGKLVHIHDLIAKRCGREVKRPKRSETAENNLNRSLTASTTLDSMKLMGAMNKLSLMDSEYREVCWDIDQRGSAGETPLHFCFLNVTSTHFELAKLILKIYPKIINDYYLCDEYFGEGCIHFALSNEDPAKVKFLLDHGANLHLRCSGNFFTPDDQKATRSENMSHEWADLSLHTNYEGPFYWGEYPLSFAACLGQEECLRLLIAKGADLNSQDTNGNTVLHMLVIQHPQMPSDSCIRLFNLLVDKGARIDIKNRQGLTPLTLAAKLPRKEVRNACNSNVPSPS